MNIGRIFGVEVKLHWSSFLMLAMFAFFGFFGSQLTSLVVGIALFLIILMHEFGHILTARFFGYPISGITLHMLGGVAVTREKADERWWQKFFVILNGPLTNLILGIILSFCISPTTWEIFLLIQQTPEPEIISSFGFMTFCLCYIYLVNWVILVFNLIPVFPLDGGQLFQSGVWGFLRLFGVKNNTARNMSLVACCSIGMVLAAACAVFFFINLNILIGLMFILGILICYVTAEDSLRKLKGLPAKY